MECVKLKGEIEADESQIGHIFRANIISNETSVSYGSFVRDVMSHRMAFEMEHVQLKGEIEVDESQMGHIKKNGRGSCVGHPIWIFGLTERETNRLY